MEGDIVEICSVELQDKELTCEKSTDANCQVKQMKSLKDLQHPKHNTYEPLYLSILLTLVYFSLGG